MSSPDLASISWRRSVPAWWRPSTRARIPNGKSWGRACCAAVGGKILPRCRLVRSFRSKTEAASAVQKTCLPQQPRPFWPNIRPIPTFLYRLISPSTRPDASFTSSDSIPRCQRGKFVLFFSFITITSADWESLDFGVRQWRLSSIGEAATAQSLSLLTQKCGERRKAPVQLWRWIVPGTFPKWKSFTLQWTIRHEEKLLVCVSRRQTWIRSSLSTALETFCLFRQQVSCRWRVYRELIRLQLELSVVGIQKEKVFSPKLTLFLFSFWGFSAFLVMRLYRFEWNCWRPYNPRWLARFLVLRSDRSDPSSASGCPTAANNYAPDPIYQAVWADTIDFNEVLISPVMVHDHMPDTVLRALNKVLKLSRVLIVKKQNKFHFESKVI